MCIFGHFVTHWHTKIGPTGASVALFSSLPFSLFAHFTTKFAHFSALVHLSCGATWLCVLAVIHIVIHNHNSVLSNGSVLSTTEYYWVLLSFLGFVQILAVVACGDLPASLLPSCYLSCLPAVRLPAFRCWQRLTRYEQANCDIRGGCNNNK